MSTTKLTKSNNASKDAFTQYLDDDFDRYVRNEYEEEPKHVVAESPIMEFEFGGEKYFVGPEDRAREANCGGGWFCLKCCLRLHDRIENRIQSRDDFRHVTIHQKEYGKREDTEGAIDFLRKIQKELPPVCIYSLDMNNGHTDRLSPHVHALLPSCWKEESKFQKKYRLYRKKVTDSNHFHKVIELMYRPIEFFYDRKCDLHTNENCEDSWMDAAVSVANGLEELGIDRFSPIPEVFLKAE